MITRLRFDYKSVYNLPVWKRNFFIKTYLDSLEKENDKNENIANSKIFKKSF